MEEGFGVIQKLLAAGFGIEIGNFASFSSREISEAGSSSSSV